MYPLDGLTAACSDFAARWPAVQLRVHTDTLGPVATLVREGTCAFGVVGPAVDTTGLVARYLGHIRMIPVVAPAHPLAAEAPGIRAARLVEEVQIVLSERTAGEGTPDQGRLVVVQPEAWPEGGVNLPLTVVTQPGDGPGAAGRWLLDRLAAACTVEPSTP